MIEGYHAKKDCALWIVQLVERVEREEFVRLRGIAKRFGGWWSSYIRETAGFQFISETTAREFLAVITDGVETVTPSASTCTETKTPTPSASAKDDPAKIAARLRKLADGITGKVEGLRADRLENTPKRHRQAQSARHDANPRERADHALRALADAWEAGTLPECLRSMRTKKAVEGCTRTRTDPTCGYYEHRETDEYSQNDAEAVALRELLEAWQSGTGAVDDDAAESRRVAQLENEARFLDIPGFFPTPPDVAKQVIDAAGILPGHRVLEPSAGIGSLADATRACVPEDQITLCEQSPKLVEILTGKGYSNVNGGDFMEQSIVDGQRFDRIVMNPPFEKLQDCAHVRHAFGMLKPGGVLVAIMGAGAIHNCQKKAVEFREWADDLGAEFENLPDGWCKSGFRSTSVSACMVTIDKPEEVEQPEADDEPEAVLSIYDPEPIVPCC